LTKKASIMSLLISILFFGSDCNREKDAYPVPPEDAEENCIIIRTKPFKIGSEEYMSDYGVITVSENRNKFNSRLINIPFLRIHSRSDNPLEPVFGLTGGPGQKNIKWDWGFAGTFLPDHDFVIVGYRGVDGSTVLYCPEVEKAFRRSSDLLSEESMKIIGQAWDKASSRFKKEGVDLDGYTMMECIEDNEAVRRKLGYERINLLSASYGTRLAYLYGTRYPESIFRSAMLSVNPPGHFVWEPHIIDSQLRYYAALWSADPVMSSKSMDLYTTIQNVLNDMPDSWLFIPINSGKVKVVTFSLLFHRNTAAQVFNSYLAAQNGDASGLAMMSLAYDFVIPSLMIWGDLASKAVSADFDPVRNYYSDMQPVAEMPLGSPMSTLLWGPLNYGEWPVSQIPEEYRNPQKSDVETLLLSGSIDFSTPAEFAASELLPYLTNGKQIILSEFGHVGDVMYCNTENTRLMLKSFYRTGVADTSMNTYLPMDFTVKWSFPVIAKTIIIIVPVVLIALASLIVWLIRLTVRKIYYHR